jgi:hypothetical protein
MNYTNTNGYKMKVSKNINKNDLVNLCENLTIKFNTMYGPEQYKFKLEDSGDINWVNFPGKVNNAYKGINLSSNEIEYKEYATSIDMLIAVIAEKPIILNTFLKAYRGAPTWCLKELQIFEEEFKKIGLNVVGKYPEKYHLTCKSRPL